MSRTTFSKHPNRAELPLGTLQELIFGRDNFRTKTRNEVLQFLERARKAAVPKEAIVVLTLHDISLLVDKDGNLLRFG